MSTSLGAWLPVMPVMAQISDANASKDTSLEEIVVTARKREESLISVPVAVTALSAADINRYNATDLSKIGQLAPQVIIQRTGGGGSGAVFAIRGISSSTTDTGLSSTVSVNIDGTQISRGRIITQGFFDLQQVEVLKGPQALFFGKNSPGGVISLRSAGPTENLEAFVRAGYEFRARERYIEGAISGPLTDTLGFRVAGRASKMRGWMRNTGGPYTQAVLPDFPQPGPADGHSPKTREFLGRLTLEWKPTSEFSSVLKIFASNYRDNGPDGTSEIKCADPNAKPISMNFTNFQSYEDPYGDCRVNGRNSNTTMNPALAAIFPFARDGAPYIRFNSILSSWTNTVNLDDISLTSVTSYYKFKAVYFENFDFTSIGSQFAANDTRSSVFSQEFRAETSLDGPLNATVGAFYDHEKAPFKSAVQLNQLGIDPATGQYMDWGEIFRTSGTTYSAFGQLDYKFTDQLILSLGARYTSESRKQLSFDYYVKPAFEAFWTAVIGAPLVLPLGQSINSRIKNDNVSPEITLTYHPTTHTTLYVAYKAGFKSGGVAQPAVLSPSFDNDTLKFKPETVRGFEIGAKGQFLDNRLRVTAAAYRYKYSDLQVQTFDPQTISFNIGNAASARTTGVEIDGAFQLSESLQIRAAGAYNLAKYLKYEDSPCYAGQTAAQRCVNTFQDLSGERLHRAPKVNLSGGFTYDTPVTEAIYFGLSGDVSYSSGFNVQETQNPLAHQSSYALVNAAAKVHAEDDSWELALIGRNLTNKYIINSSLDKPFGPPGQIAVGVSRPREIAVQGTVRF
jgi:outer membrane receptor protein involved in Fe transport